MGALFSFSWLPASITSSDWALSLSQFMHQGGQVQWWLAAVLFVIWLLVIERFLYLTRIFPKQREQWVERWHQRHDQTSWYAHSIRAGWLSEAKVSLNQNLKLIKVLVAICPMLGLLGTVTGMIAVFDVMAIQGSSNPKLMAAGISLATLTTLSGMVAALVGMFIHSRLTKACHRRHVKLEQDLRSQS